MAPFSPRISNAEAAEAFGLIRQLRAAGRSAEVEHAKSTAKTPRDLLVALRGSVGKSRVSKPLGRWPDFDACVREMAGKLGSQEAARRYCGRLEQQANG